MKNGAKIAAIAALVVLPMVVVAVYAISARSGGNSGITGDIVKIDWRTLREYNVDTRTATEGLQKLDGGRVRMPGFMVPLEDNQSRVTEFLLVPSPQACIHVPPPPANQMILVRMAGGGDTAIAFGPIWVQGRLHISDGTHQYGTSSFTMQAEFTEEYRYE